MPRGPRPAVGSWSLAFVFFLWLGITMGWVGLLAFEKASLGPTSCPITPGSSTYGEASWSWLPPGKVCTFAAVDGGMTRRPPPHRILVGGGLLLWGGSLVALTAQRVRQHEPLWVDAWSEEPVARSGR